MNHVRPAPASGRQTPAPVRAGAATPTPVAPNPAWRRLSLLPVSQPGDASEREADRVADAVMRGDTPGAALTGSAPPSAPLQRACAACEDEQTLKRQADANVDGPPAAVPGDLGPAQPLDAATRGFFEPRLGRDLSAVRVHTGAAADAAARALRAQAFTLGHDIAFARHRYQPATTPGRRLLAHELAHVLQSRPAAAPTLQRSLAPAGPGGEGPAPGLQGKAPPTPTPPPESCPPPATMDCQPASASPPSVRLTLDFAVDSERLTAQQRADIDAVAAAWRAGGGGGELRIDGYASAEGDCGYNWLLSCRRAHAVADELARPGDRSAPAPASQIELFAHGESNEGGRGLAANRRATLSLVAPAPAPAPTPVPVPPPTPVTPAPAPCALPVHLGTGRTGCGSGTDFRHNDFPAISTASSLKLRAWAATHPPGGLIGRSGVSDVDCMTEMAAVLGGTAGPAGLAAFTHFVGGSGATVTHGAYSMLGLLARFSPQFAATVTAVRADIEAQLAAQAPSGVLDPCALAVTPPPTSWHLSFIPPLEAVIGGTHGETLFADAFSGSAAARTYSIDLRFIICDNFGVDEHDLYAPGLFPFWVLQHERGSSLYAPFINELELPVTVSGRF